jgi:hypothetical protein
MCKEPIWNFICIDCIGKDIENLLPFDMRSEFSIFHRDIKRCFYSDYDKEPCIKCKTENSVCVCLACYTSELYLWFLDKNPDLAKKLLRISPSDKRRRYVPPTMDDIQTISELRNKEKIDGICDACGEYSDDLEESEGVWVCDDCRRMV